MSRNLVSKICLNEIKLCHDQSNGPYFVAFLSHRYGQRTLPTEIANQEFKILVAESVNVDVSFQTQLTESRTIRLENLLEAFYKMDENDLSRPFKLASADQIIDDFDFKDKNFDRLFTESQNRLLKLLRELAAKCFDKKLLSEEQKNKYFISSKFLFIVA